MMHEQMCLRFFGKEISNIINNLNEKNNNLLINQIISRCPNKNVILSQNNNSTKFYYINGFCFEKTKYLLKNENINDSSYIMTKNTVNNTLSFAKNILERNNIYNKTEEFLTEILIGLKLDEKINFPDYSNNIFKNQDIKDINERHRGVVIEWLSYVNHFFNKSNETLFMCINIMDRYTSKRTISLNIYQLVGISSFLIASKYEDTDSPPIDKLIYISKYIYTHNDIVSMEKDILVTLNFDIFSVSTFHFFSYFYVVSEINNKKLFHLGQLILEICLLNIEIMSYNQSLIALGAILIAKKCLDIKEGTNNIKIFYNYTEEDIKEIQKKIILFLSNVVYNDKNNLIMDKFEKNRYMSVSHIFRYDKQYCKIHNNNDNSNDF